MRDSPFLVTMPLHSSSAISYSAAIVSYNCGVVSNSPGLTISLRLRGHSSHRTSRVCRGIAHFGYSLMWKLFSFTHCSKPNLLRETPFPEFFQPVHARSYLAISTLGIRPRPHNLPDLDSHSGSQSTFLPLPTPLILLLSEYSVSRYWP